MNIMIENSCFTQFMPFTIIDKEEVHAIGYNKNTGVLMLIVELDDKQKQETHKQYIYFYYKDVPASLAYSMLKGLNFDCFHKNVFNGQYKILDFKYGGADNLCITI